MNNISKKNPFSFQLSVQSLEDSDEVPQLIFLCGADLLESFNTPDLWIASDV